MTTRLDEHFASNEYAAALARTATARLEGLLAVGVLDRVLLLVSELVTNSVRHAGSGPGNYVGLRLEVDDNRVRGEVSDAGGGFSTVVSLPKPEEASGWGLFLTDRVADRWGVQPGARTRTWFEIDFT